MYTQLDYGGDLLEIDYDTDSAEEEVTDITVKLGNIDVTNLICGGPAWDSCWNAAERHLFGQPTITGKQLMSAHFGAQQ